MDPPIAYFSTFGGKFKADRANGMKQLIRSDAGDGDDRFIALLRQRFPRKCDGIWGPITHSYQLNEWFDRNDFETHGVNYLTSVINQIAFENCRRFAEAKKFIEEWTKLNAAQILSRTGPRKACEIFNKEEIDSYGGVFLDKALESIWIEKEETARKGDLHFGRRDTHGKETPIKSKCIDTAPTQLPGGNSHDTIVKEDQPAVDVAPIQKPNESLVQQPNDGNSDLNLGDGQFKDDAAWLKPFRRERSRSNPEWAVEEEQIVAVLTPIQLPARARRKTDTEEWVKDHNLAKILGVTEDPTPAPIDTSLSPHLHVLHHLPPSQHSESLNEILDFDPYHQPSSPSKIGHVFVHEIAAWAILPDHLKVETKIEVHPNAPTSTDSATLLIPLAASVRWLTLIPPNRNRQLAASSQHPPALVSSTSENNVTRAAASSETVPKMYSGNMQYAGNHATEFPGVGSSTRYQQSAHNSGFSSARVQQGPMPPMAPPGFLPDPRGQPPSEFARLLNNPVAANHPFGHRTPSGHAATPGNSVRRDYVPSSQHRPFFVPAAYNEQTHHRDPVRSSQRSSENTAYQEHQQASRLPTTSGHAVTSVGSNYLPSSENRPFFVLSAQNEQTLHHGPMRRSQRSSDNNGYQEHQQAFRLPTTSGHAVTAVRSDYLPSSETRPFFVPAAQNEQTFHHDLVRRSQRSSDNTAYQEHQQTQRDQPRGLLFESPAPERPRQTSNASDRNANFSGRRQQISSSSEIKSSSSRRNSQHNIGDMRTDLYVGSIPAGLDATCWMDYFRMLPQCKSSAPLRSLGSSDYFFILRFQTARDADRAKHILETTPCPLFPSDRQMTIEFPLRKTNQAKHSVWQLRRRLPADNADRVAIQVSRTDDRKENRPAMEATSSSALGPNQCVAPGQYQQSSTATEKDEGQSTRKVDPRRQRHKDRIQRRKDAENTSSEGASSQPAGTEGAAVLATTTNTKPANDAPVKPAETQPAEDLASGTNAGSARDASTKSAGTEPTKFQSSVSAEGFPSNPLVANRSTANPSSTTPGMTSRRSELYNILQKPRGSKAEPEKKAVASLPSTHTQEAGKPVASPSQLGTLMVEPVAELMARGDSSSSHEVPMTDQSQLVSTMPTTHDPSETSESESDHLRNTDSNLVGHPNDNSLQAPYGTTEEHRQGVEHEIADTAALARRTNEAANVTPKAKRHEPRTRKPIDIIAPAVPDMHKLNQLLMKQKQTEQSNVEVKNAQEAMASGVAVRRADSPTYGPAKTALPTSNTFIELQDFMNEDQAGSPSSGSKTPTGKSPSPEYSTPPQNSPTKQVMDNVDETWSQTVAEATSTADQRHESPGDVTASDPTVQSSEQIPVMHDSANPAAQTAEVGSVPAGDDPSQTAEPDAMRDNTSGMTGQSGEQNLTRDNTSDTAGQPGEQDVTGRNPSAAAASKAARNKKKNLKRKEKKEREKREADQEVNSGSDTVASSSTAHGARSISFRSERPLDFHVPVALQPGQVSNQPAASSLSQLAHEYHGTFGQQRTIGTQVSHAHSDASTAGNLTKASKRRSMVNQYEGLRDTITQLCAQMKVDAGQVAKDMVAEKTTQFKEAPASPENVKALGLLQKQLDAYLKPPIGLKYMETAAEAEFTHSLIDYVQRRADERKINQKNEGSSSASGGLPISSAGNIEHAVTAELEPQPGSKTADAGPSSGATTNPLAQDPTSGLPPLYKIIFPDLPPANSTDPSPLLSKIVKNTIHIPNPGKPGKFAPAVQDIVDPNKPTASLSVWKPYNLQTGDTVHFSPVDGSVATVLRGDQSFYRCAPVCRRDDGIKARLEQELDPGIARFFWNGMVGNMTRMWTSGHEIDTEALRRYIAPEMEAIQRTLWENEMKQVMLSNEKAMGKIEAMERKEAMQRAEAVEFLDEVTGLRQRQFREANVTEANPLEVEGALGEWLREGRSGDQVKIPEEE